MVGRRSKDMYRAASRVGIFDFVAFRQTQKSATHYYIS